MRGIATLRAQATLQWGLSNSGPLRKGGTKVTTEQLWSVTESPAGQTSACVTVTAAWLQGLRLWFEQRSGVHAKGRRLRAWLRARAAEAAQTDQGREVGGRPPGSSHRYQRRLQGLVYRSKLRQEERCLQNKKPWRVGKVPNGIEVIYYCC